MPRWLMSHMTSVRYKAGIVLKDLQRGALSIQLSITDIAWDAATTHDLALLHLASCLKWSLACSWRATPLSG